jgi:hypothetical protein
LLPVAFLNAAMWVTVGWNGRSAFNESRMGFAMGQWKAPVVAPRDRDVEVRLTDGVEEYLPTFLCRRTEEGWINSKFKTALPNRYKIVAWRPQE